jgi:hypothetical protein
VDFSRSGLSPKAADFRSFAAWARAVTWNLPKGPAQMFFIREGTPNPSRDRPEIERSLKSYLRWGYFGTDNLNGSKPGRKLTLLGTRERARILSELARKQARITVDDYISACDRKVHRRTAERDLRSSPRLGKRGHTRNAFYLVKRKAR